MEITRHRQCSAALKIPSEIAVHVFKLSALTGLFTLDFKGTLDWKILQKLSHVCADWRLLVTQTAHLWMKLSYFWTANTTKQVEMIRVHLHRSQNLPLSLSLRYEPRGYGSALNRQPIFDTIVPLFSRLKEFAFTGVIFEDLSQLGSISRSHSLPLLESLQLSHLGFCDEEGLPEPFGRVKLVTPTLRKVDLREIPLDFFSVTLKQATSLSLADSEYTGTAVKKAFASAVHAEKMVITLRAWKKQNVRRKNVPSPKDFLALKSLQLMVTCLEEEIEDKEDNERFDISPVWQSFTAPNLKTLAIEGFVGWNQQTFVQFAARSLSNLRTLDISIYGIPATGWGDIFYTLSQPRGILHGLEVPGRQRYLERPHHWQLLVTSQITSAQQASCCGKE